MLIYFPIKRVLCLLVWSFKFPVGIFFPGDDTSLFERFRCVRLRRERFFSRFVDKRDVHFGHKLMYGFCTLVLISQGICFLDEATFSLLSISYH